MEIRRDLMAPQVVRTFSHVVCVKPVAILANHVSAQSFSDNSKVRSTECGYREIQKYRPK